MSWIPSLLPKSYVPPDTWNPFAHLWAAKEFYDEKRRREITGKVTSWKTGNIRTMGFVNLNGRVVHINSMYKSAISEDEGDHEAEIHRGYLVNMKGERLQLAD